MSTIPQTGQQSPVQNPPSPYSQGVDPLILAFYYLMEASNISSNTAMIHAKQLNQNALSQQRVNSQMAHLQNYSIPVEGRRYTYIAHTHWHWEFWHHGFHYTTYQKVTIKTNQGAIDNAQAKNQVISAERQVLSDQLTLMQQTAQIKETDVNSVTQEASQSIQEGGDLLQILQDLTFQALLRQPPQN